MKTATALVVATLISASPAGNETRQVSRIMHGEEAGKSEFPWIMLLVYKWGGPEECTLTKACGGTLIHQRWVLSAASCLPDRAETVEIHPGLIRRSEADEAKPIKVPRSANPENWIKHSNFSYGVVPVNDFLLIRLADEDKIAAGKYGGSVKPICIKKDAIGNNVEAVVAGWGVTARSLVGEMSETLMKANVKTMAQEKCVQSVEKYFKEKLPLKDTVKKFGLPTDSEGLNQAWKESVKEYLKSFEGHSAKLFEGALCTKTEKGPGMGSCTGDSGGPIVAKNKEGDHELVGVVSWSPKDHWCWCTKRLAVHGRISGAVDWIKNFTEKDYEEGMEC